jgi:hypothetical protein
VNWQFHHRRDVRRRRLASVALLLWLLGLEILPNVHLSQHAGSALHVHDASGIVVRVMLGDPESMPHRHRDGQVHASTMSATAVSTSLPSTQRVKKHSDVGLEHGAGSLAHRQLVIACAPPALPVVVRCQLRDVELAVEVRPSLLSMDALAPKSRGPPTLSLPTQLFSC